MAVWDTNSALASFRSQLGDGDGDHFEFKSPVFPTPDSVTTRFFCGQTRLVPDTLQVYHQGELVSPSGVPDEATGTFSYAPSGVAPSGEIEVSFYYQWFTDAELLSFLNDATNLFGYEDLTAATIDIGLRPAIIAYAMVTAYLRKAAEFAETVEASAQGYTFGRGRAAPNWKSLADAAMETAKEKLKLFVEKPIGTRTPTLRFVAYELQRYVPGS